MTVSHIISPVRSLSGGKIICGAEPGPKVSVHRGLDEAYRAHAGRWNEHLICPDCMRAIWVAMGMSL